MDKLAQHSQEEIAFGVGEVVGETVAFEGAGALIGRGASILSKPLSRTRIGAATMKVFAETSNKIGAVRQSIRSFESKALQSVGKKIENLKTKKWFSSNLESQRGSLILRDGPTPFEAGKTSLKQFDIDLYKNFNTRWRRGDSLEGHELLQNKWLEVNGFTERRGVGIASRENPAIALSEPLPDLVGLEQRRLGLFDAENLRNMSVVENISLNSEAMRRAVVPEHIIQTLEKESLRHARRIGAITE